MRSLMTFVLTSALTLTTLTAVRGQEQKDAVREIDLKGLKLGAGKGKVTNPMVIASVEELQKAIPGEDVQNKIKGQVDFAKEKVLYFAWAGSGGDKLTPDVDMKDKQVTVNFRYKGGLTNDLRQHHHVFVIPKDATWNVITKGN